MTYLVEGDGMGGGVAGTEDGEEGVGRDCFGAAGGVGCGVAAD